MQVRWKEARGSQSCSYVFQDWGGIFREREERHKNRNTLLPPPPGICTRMQKGGAKKQQQKKREDTCSTLLEGTWEESKDGTSTAGQKKGTMGDLWASTLLLHQYALRVQTRGVLGSLCWCAKTHPLLFLLLLLITKTLRGCSSSKQLMNEAFSITSHVRTLTLLQTIVSILRKHRVLPVQPHNWDSSKCQQFWSRSIALVVNQACCQLNNIFPLTLSTLSNGALFLIEP